MTIARVLHDYCDAWRAGDLARIVVAALGEATRRSGRQLVEIVDVLAGGELGAIVAVERVGAAGDTTDIRRVLVYRVRDEQLVECWLYDEDQRLVDGLWSG
jgi:uncharacterized protein